MEKINSAMNYRIIHLSSFKYSQFRKFEIQIVLHFVVPNFDPHPRRRSNIRRRSSSRRSSSSRRHSGTQRYQSTRRRSNTRKFRVPKKHIRVPENFGYPKNIFEYPNTFGYPTKIFEYPNTLGYPKFPGTRPKKIKIIRLTRPEKMFWPHTPTTGPSSNFLLFKNILLVLA